MVACGGYGLGVGCAGGFFDGGVGFGEYAYCLHVGVEFFEL